MRDKCYQREVAEREAALDPRRRDTGPIDYTVEPIEAKEAAAFIRRYEWLGNVGSGCLASYGARDFVGDLAAVAILSRPANVQSAALCRPLDPRRLTDEDRAYIRTVACLSRGATAHWAHPHTASWFIPRALEMAQREHGLRVVFAYSDPNAGEVGIVDQACNWLYLGIAPGRDLRAGKPKPRWQFRKDGGRWKSDRAFYRAVSGGLTVADARRGVDGWETREYTPKGKYVTFLGNLGERRQMRRTLRYPVQPYPKWDLE